MNEFFTSSKLHMTKKSRGIKGGFFIHSEWERAKDFFACLRMQSLMRTNFGKRGCFVSGQSDILEYLGIEANPNLFLLANRYLCSIHAAFLHYSMLFAKSGTPILLATNFLLTLNESCKILCDSNYNHQYD